MKKMSFGVLILSAIFVSQAAAQQSTVKSPRDIATGSASVRDCVVRGDKATKKNCLADTNIVRSVGTTFSRSITDALGRSRQVRVSKVDRLRSEGYRYSVTIDGQRREISYLIIKPDEVAVINIDGAKPEQNLYITFYGKSQANLTAEMWAGQRLLTETFAPNGNQAFSIPESHVDEFSFALYTMAMNQIQELDPSRLFPGSGPDNAASAFGVSGLFGKGIGARLGCRFKAGTTKRCGTGCTPTPTAEDEGWNLFGSKRRRECAASGCMMCAGICCKSETCNSVQDRSIDCAAGLTGGSGARTELFFTNSFESFEIGSAYADSCGK